MVLYYKVDPVVGEEMNGKTITVKINTSFIIRLMCRHYKCHYDGYEWFLDVDGSPIAQLMESFPELNNAPSIKAYQWRFMVTQLGTTVIRLSYKQSWTGRPRKYYNLPVKCTIDAPALRLPLPEHPYGS